MVAREVRVWTSGSRSGAVIASLSMIMAILGVRVRRGGLWIFLEGGGRIGVRIEPAVLFGVQNAGLKNFGGILSKSAIEDGLALSLSQAWEKREGGGFEAWGSVRRVISMGVIFC